jgi:hypothetical protein
MTARKELWPIKPFVFSLGYLGDDEALNSLDWAIVVKGGKRVSNIIIIIIISIFFSYRLRLHLL